MNTLVMVVLGAGVGLGVLLCARALRPRPVPIGALLAGLARPGRALTDDSDPGAPRSDNFGRVAQRTIEAAGVDVGRYRHDLELVGRSTERHALDKLFGGIAGLLMPNLIAVALATLGVGPPLGLVAVLSLGTAVLGFLMPDFLLHDEAFPRSVRHCLDRAAHGLKRVRPGGSAIGARTQRELGHLERTLSEDGARGRDEAHAMLTHLIEGLAATCEAFHYDFFGHVSPDERRSSADA